MLIPHFITETSLSTIFQLVRLAAAAAACLLQLLRQRAEQQQPAEHAVISLGLDMHKAPTTFGYTCMENDRIGVGRRFLSTLWVSKYMRGINNDWPQHEAWLVQSRPSHCNLHSGEVKFPAVRPMRCNPEGKITDKMGRRVTTSSSSRSFES